MLYQSSRKSSIPADEILSAAHLALSTPAQSTVAETIWVDAFPTSTVAAAMSLAQLPLAPLAEIRKRTDSSMTAVSPSPDEPFTPTVPSYSNIHTNCMRVNGTTVRARETSSAVVGFTLHAHPQPLQPRAAGLSYILVQYRRSDQRVRRV